MITKRRPLILEMINPKLISLSKFTLKGWYPIMNACHTLLGVVKHFRSSFNAYSTPSILLFLIQRWNFSLFKIFLLFFDISPKFIRVDHRPCAILISIFITRLFFEGADHYFADIFRVSEAGEWADLLSQARKMRTSIFHLFRGRKSANG